MNKERIQKALDSLVYLPHLKEKALHSAISPVSEDAGGKGRVWDRGDLFRRLQTYKPATWFCKPNAISPVECARRGWLNTGPDMLTCEFCKAKVNCPIAPQLLPEEVGETAARYAEHLTDSHDSACPWRSNCCAASLLQFPPLTQEAVREDFAKRAASLQRLVCLPPLHSEAYATAAGGSQQAQRALDQLLLKGPGPAAAAARRQQAGAAGAQQEQGEAQAGAEGAGQLREALFEGVVTWNAEGYEPRLRLLALCGWDLKVVSAAAAGAAEGASAGSLTAAAGSSGDAVAPMPGPRGAQGGQAPSSSSSHVGPECSALLCTLCGAKAGMWAFFPRCRPAVLHATARARGAAARGAAPTGRGGPTTIAGGLLASSTSALPATPATMAGGPFGGHSYEDRALFGAPMPLLFGTPGALPARNIAGGSIAAAAAAVAAAATAAGAQPAAPGAAATAAAATAAEQPGEAAGAPVGPFGAGPSGAGAVPIFGVAALKAASPAQPAPAAAGAESGKRKELCSGEAGAGAEAAAEGPAQKRGRASTEGAGGEGEAGPPAAAAPLQYCTAEVLRRYSEQEAVPLDPLALHRPFCPWVNQAAQGMPEGVPARCGWKWCLHQLVPGADEGGSVGAAAQAGGEGRQWDPAKRFRAVMSRVS